MDKPKKQLSDGCSKLKGSKKNGNERGHTCALCESRNATMLSLVPPNLSEQGLGRPQPNLPTRSPKILFFP